MTICSAAELCAALKAHHIPHKANVQPNQSIAKLEAWKRERALSSKREQESTASSNKKARPDGVEDEEGEDAISNNSKDKDNGSEMPQRAPQNKGVEVGKGRKQKEKPTSIAVETAGAQGGCILGGKAQCSAVWLRAPNPFLIVCGYLV